MKLTLGNLLEARAERKREIDDVVAGIHARQDTRTITGLRLGGGADWRGLSQQRMDEIGERVVQRIVDAMGMWLAANSDPHALAGFGDVPVDKGAPQKLTIPDERGTRFVAYMAKETDAATVGDVRTVESLVVGGGVDGSGAFICRDGLKSYDGGRTWLGIKLTSSDYKTAPAGVAFEYQQQMEKEPDSWWPW